MTSLPSSTSKTTSEESKESKESKESSKTVLDWVSLNKEANDGGRSIQINHLISEKIKQKILLKDSKEYKNNLQFINLVKENSTAALQSYALLINHRGWQTQVDNYENISVYYRKEKCLNIDSIKIKFKLKCPVLHLLSVLNEYDLIGEVMKVPGCTITTQYLKEISYTEKILFAQLNLIWPLRHRDSVTHVKAFDLLDTYGCILIRGHTIDKYENLKIPKPKDRTVRIGVKMAYGMITPIRLRQLKENKNNKNNKNNNKNNNNKNSEQKTEDEVEELEVTAVFNIDFKTILPPKLINWVTRTFTYYGIQSFRERCQNLKGTKHEQRIKEKQVYKMWQQKMSEYQNTLE